MMPAHLPAVRLGDLLIARPGAHFELRIALGQRPLRRRGGWPAAETRIASAARAHSRFHAREFQARYAQSLGGAHQDVARGRGNTVSGEGGTQLQLYERRLEVVAQAAGLAQLFHAETRIVGSRFPRPEAIDGRRDL